MSRFSKHYAKVMISDPTAVKNKCLSTGQLYDNGAIFVSCPEIGMEGTNLIYCRYCLSIPYVQVQVGWYVWIEPTIDDTERWIYVGIADAGGIDVASKQNQMMIAFLNGVLYATTAGQLLLSSESATEPFVLGNELQSWFQDFITNVFNMHTHSYVTPLHPGPPGVTGASGTPGVVPSTILSTKIFGE